MLSHQRHMLSWRREGMCGWDVFDQNRIIQGRISTRAMQHLENWFGLFCVLLSRSTHLIFSITRNVRLYFSYLFTFTSQNMEPTSLLCLISFPRQLLKSLKMFVGLFMTSGTDKDYECGVATANVKQRCLIKVSQHILWTQW